MPKAACATGRVETASVKLFNERPLRLECGSELGPITVAFEAYGTLNAQGTNAMLVCHALTANAHAAGYHEGDPHPGWWDGLIGPGKALDTDRFFVVCPNILGSCYGTTGPTSLNPVTGTAFRLSFPPITVRDIVRVQRKLLAFLGVRKLATVIGSSLGGMQVVEWGVMYPEFAQTLVPISTSARQSAWCIGLNAAVRAAITGDPEWRGGHYQEQPETGLSIARMIGMISYRSPGEFAERFGRKRQSEGLDFFDGTNLFQVESYLRHQGKKLAGRFDANTYIVLSHVMDRYDVGHQRGSIASVLGEIAVPVLAIGVSSDIRYPSVEQKELVRLMPNAHYAEIDSIHGHDAFLIEYDQLNRLVTEFLNTSLRGTV